MKNQESLFEFYENTPFTSVADGLHFSSNAERDVYFNYNNRFNSEKFNGEHFNHVRDRWTVAIPCDYEKAKKWNYGRFYELAQDMYWYFFIESSVYDSPEVTLFKLVPDLVTTFCQGNTLNQYMKNLLFTRQHLTKSKYMNNLIKLRTNDDVINAQATNRIVKKDIKNFNTIGVVIQASVDLTAKFGDMNKPNYTTSSGVTYDEILSPINLYYCDKDDFQGVMNYIKKYSWIAQNIRQTFLIPRDFIDLGDTEAVKIDGGQDGLGLRRFKGGGHSTNYNPAYQKNWAELQKIFKCEDEFDLHLMRGEYCNITATLWQGSQLDINPAYLDSNEPALKYNTEIVIGHDNIVSIYPKGYKSDNEEVGEGLFAGTFMGNSLTISDWGNVPQMIDNYQLQMAQNANRRELENSKTLTGRIGQVFGANSSPQDRVFNALSVVSSLSSVSSLLSSAGSEYEYWRDQKAQQADMKLQMPTIDTLNNSNNLQIANGYFGLTTIYSRISESELHRISKYHRKLGFSWEWFDDVDDVNSMTIVNHVMAKGNWKIPNVPPEYMTALQALFETGVNLWHLTADGVSNPFTQDIMKNTWKG